MLMNLCRDLCSQFLIKQSDEVAGEERKKKEKDRERKRKTEKEKERERQKEIKKERYLMGLGKQVNISFIV